MDTDEIESNMKLEPGDEVQRLQDLVKKLEVQNQLLRSKHSSDSDLKSKNKTDNVMNDIQLRKDHTVESSYDDNNAQKHNSNSNDCVVNNIIDDFDILDVDSVPALEDEESWLFTSPKRSVKQKISPYKWMRQEFESPDVEPGKRSLVYKLDEVARSSPITARSPIDTRTFTRPPKTIDTRTFTRPPKSILSARQSPSNTLSTQADSSRSLSPSHSPRNASPRDASPRNASPRDTSPRNVSPRNSPEYDRNGNASAATASSPSSTSSSSAAGPASRIPDTVDSVPARNPAADVMDIQVMARMQEESLRQSINASPKKTFKKGRSLKQVQYQQQQQQHQQGDHDSSESSTRSSPARFEGDLYQVHRSSNNSLAGSLSSHSNSPPDSPYSSTQQLHRPVSEMHRRSLPNLSGRQSLSPALHSHPSDTSLQSKNTAAEPPPTLHTYTPRRLVKPPSSSLSQRGGAYSAMQKPGSGVPRGIPSPSGGRGGIPRPRTSRLPAPRSRIPAAGRQAAQASNHSNHGDDSWKDGCF